MRRRNKVFATLFVVAAALTLIFLNTGAQTASSALAVSDAKRQAAELDGRVVTVRGTVVEGTLVESGSRLVEFVIADASERLRVEFNDTAPDNFGVKEVVVKGELLVGDDSVPYLVAHEIKVGCASKY